MVGGVAQVRKNNSWSSLRRRPRINVNHITFTILPGCEWHDAAVELCHYLMMDAGKEPGRGSAAGFFQGFPVTGCAAYRHFTEFVTDRYGNSPANYRLVAAKSCIFMHIEIHFPYEESTKVFLPAVCGPVFCRCLWGGDGHFSAVPFLHHRKLYQCY